ncbi:hypothetical protein J2Y00_004676 [Deinococcus soli (ex Cha et al. 2016)]|uniref:Uncharacterized protein n=2 Tax=Deinococcus soli (ex Cha et al. 2016) TaxID=1309411 RepID=A0ACC6KNV1_9DEIO|nr:hypothetical protein [Deinococcus soli (ex Cha et al. 2016)]MDR6331359.1 hypothetical protein [Deinococcus soli (ex Cha et al. 2016)]MDR6754136.1 hypothetical protein [Deinococcus soli (ex Cha et al. 2016)]
MSLQTAPNSDGSGSTAATRQYTAQKVSVQD